MLSTIGILLALWVRERTGKGQEVDTSLFSSGVYTMSYDITGALITGQDRQKVAREEVENPLASYYETKDERWIRIGIVQPDLYWSKFCYAIGKEELEHDTRFSEFEPRINNHSALFVILEEIFKTNTYDEWKEKLTKANLPWGPIQNLSEITQEPQARANDTFITMHHPVHGCIEVVNNPIRLSKTKIAPPQAAAEFGQNTETILLEHGYSWDDITRFKERSVIA